MQKPKLAVAARSNHHFKGQCKAFDVQQFEEGKHQKESAHKAVHILAWRRVTGSKTDQSNRSRDIGEDQIEWINACSLRLNYFNIWQIIADLLSAIVPEASEGGIHISCGQSFVDLQLCDRRLQADFGIHHVCHAGKRIAHLGHAITAMHAFN